MTAISGRAAGLRYSGNLDELSADERSALLRRSVTGAETGEVARATTRIIESVRDRGDAALLAFARAFDGVELTALEVPRAAMRNALDRVDRELLRAMERSIRNLETVHLAYLPVPAEVEPEPGLLVGRRPDPVGAVGLYVPGGRAAYASSVLMAAVPARVAGVPDIIMCSPPGVSGVPAAPVLAAAALCGVESVFAIGGAGAIAAMAYGTESVPRVDRVVGPGNAYVAEAKRQLVGVVGIDSPAGPSELLVIADAHADVVAVAREMIAQAEHDPLACVLALVTDDAAATQLERELTARACSEPRATIVREALGAAGGVLRTRSIEAAVEFGNVFAPEHLLLAVAAPDAALARVRNAGAVFLGDGSSVTFGDYMSGANHVLPTGGSARSYSGLSTPDFMRWTYYQRCTREGAAALSADVAAFARAENLPAHARAAAAWRGAGS